MTIFPINSLMYMLHVFLYLNSVSDCVISTSGSSVAGRLVHCRICQSYNWYANCPMCDLFYLSSSLFSISTLLYLTLLFSCETDSLNCVHLFYPWCDCSCHKFHLHFPPSILLVITSHLKFLFIFPYICLFTLSYIWTSKAE